MAINVTRWSPDTCDCVVEYAWDGEVPAEQRVHTLHAVERRCAHHAHLAEPAVYAALAEENPRKNLALELLGEVVPHLAREVATADGGSAKVVEHPWYFDDARVLHFTGAGMTDDHKAALHAAADARFGVGRVRID